MSVCPAARLRTIGLVVTRQGTGVGVGVLVGVGVGAATLISVSLPPVVSQVLSVSPSPLSSKSAVAHTAVAPTATAVTVVE